MIYIIFKLMKPFNEILCPVDGEFIILALTISIRIEMIHHKIKDQSEQLCTDLQ